MAQPDSNAVIDRVFAILETCAESRRTISLADLARLTDLPKSTLHRICWKLESLGALEHHGMSAETGADREPSRARWQQGAVDR